MGNGPERTQPLCDLPDRGANLGRHQRGRQSVGYVVVAEEWQRLTWQHGRLAEHQKPLGPVVPAVRPALGREADMPAGHRADHALYDGIVGIGDPHRARVRVAEELGLVPVILFE